MSEDKPEMDELKPELSILQRKCKQQIGERIRHARLKLPQQRLTSKHERIPQRNTPGMPGASLDFKPRYNHVDNVGSLDKRELAGQDEFPEGTHHQRG